MNTLSLDPKIIGMAHSLKLNGDDPLQSIMAFCRKRVAQMLKSGGAIQTIWDFESLEARRERFRSSHHGLLPQAHNQNAEVGGVRPINLGF